MKFYCIFDDFGKENIEIIKKGGHSVSICTKGKERPDRERMKKILENYDGVIIGTSQQITEDMFENIESEKVIATASVGTDHICIPDNKKNMITLINTPIANAQSAAEYTIGCALACCKRLVEGNELYKKGLDNKKMSQRPEDLAGKTIGVIGAGNISVKIMEYAQLFGMNVLCWTKHPELHKKLKESGIIFLNLYELVKKSDIISVNLPNNLETKNIISSALVDNMKETAIFISISRLETLEIIPLFKKAIDHENFYVCLDLDVNPEIVLEVPKIQNVMITPHIAGGTVEARKRMFNEVAQSIATLFNKESLK